MTSGLKTVFEPEILDCGQDSRRAMANLVSGTRLEFDSQLMNLFGIEREIVLLE